MNREAQILQALQGELPLAARKALVVELNSIRTRAAHRVATAREVELGKEAAAAHLTPAPTYVRHTSDTDWLGKVGSVRQAPAEIHQQAKSEAGAWMRQVSALARADHEELRVQAVGYAQVWGSQFGELATVARDSFLQTASHLAGVKLAADDEDEPKDDDDSDEAYTEADDDSDGGNPFADDDDEEEGSKKEARRVVAARPRAQGQEWSTTCSECGETETGTDYYNGWPSQDAFHRHLFCGPIPDGGYQDQDLAIDRYSSLRTAAEAYDWRNWVGHAYMGFPGSEIVSISPSTDYLMNGPRGTGPGHQAPATMVLRTEDGRELTIPIDLATAHRQVIGARRIASENCSRCGGSGAVNWPSSEGSGTMDCPKCKGTGQVGSNKESRRTTAEADGIDSPSPDSQNGYAESTLPDVSVPSAPEDTNMGWIAEGDPNAVTAMGHFEAMFMRSAADQVTSGPLYDAASKDSSLGVGHVWTNTSCPAYKSYDPKDCTCAKKAASRTAAREGWWPLVPSSKYPGENDLVCPACGSADVSISGNNLGRDIITNNLYTSLTCNSCGRRDILPEKPKDLRGASRKHAEADGIDSPSPQSQNGYAETTLTDVSVGSAPDDTNLGWIADGDPNAEDEASFEAPDNPIANEASRTAAGPAGFWCPKCKKYQSTRTPAQLKAAREHVPNCQGKKESSLDAHFARLVEAGDNDRPAGEAAYKPTGVDVSVNGYTYYNVTPEDIKTIYEHYRKTDPSASVTKVRGSRRTAAEVTRFDDGHSEWKCSRCKATVYRYRGESDVSCDRCGAEYNAAGQQLRDDWRGNMSNYDDEIGDMEGYEIQHANDDRDYSSQPGWNSAYGSINAHFASLVTAGKAYDKGMADGKIGDGIQYNPYPFDSQDGAEWIRGYRDAQGLQPGQKASSKTAGKAYNEGLKDGKLGDGIQYNPYPFDSQDGAEWIRGYRDAQGLQPGQKASSKTAGDNNRPAGAAPMVDQVTDDAEDDVDMFGGEWVHEGRRRRASLDWDFVDSLSPDEQAALVGTMGFGHPTDLNEDDWTALFSSPEAASWASDFSSRYSSRRQAMHPDDDPSQGPGYLNDAPNLLGDPPGMDPEDYDMFAPELPKQARKTAMPAPADLGINVGDIFYNSWGYDQTNIDYYKVVRLTPAGVEIVPIGKKYVQRNGPGGDQVVPDPDSIRDYDTITGIERGGKGSKVCRIKGDGGRYGPYIVLNDRHSATRWDGRPDYATDPMFGH